MVVVSYSGKEINAKLVYYGAGLSGKTTNLEALYEAVPETSRGKMVSMKTQSDRTLFFDLLPLDLGEIMGFKTRFLLYTVPGQVFYNATRKLVLKGADAIVFVADSEVGKMEENKESLSNLRANLAEYSVNLDQLPWVIQYNKRDLPNVYTVEELNAEVNPGGKVPFFEAVATQGKGVFETFRGISHMLMEKVTRDLRRTPFASGSNRPAAAEEPARPEPARTPTAAPMAPARTIAQEAHSSPPALAEASLGGLDYGREIELPGTIPPAAPAHEPVPARAPEPAAPVAARPAPEPVSRVPRPTVEARVQAPTPAPAPAAARPMPGGPAPINGPTQVPASGPFAAPAPISAPAPIAVPAPIAAPTPREAPAAQGPAAPARAAKPNAEVVEVPVRINRNGSCEIVIRIVVQDQDKAA